MEVITFILQQLKNMFTVLRNIQTPFGFSLFSLFFGLAFVGVLMGFYISLTHAGIALGLKNAKTSKGSDYISKRKKGG